MKTQKPKIQDGEPALDHQCVDCKPTHTPALVEMFDKFCASDMEHKDNRSAMREEIVKAVNCHEELLALIKTAYCIVAEAMPEQSPNPSAFVVVQKEWLKKAEQVIAKASEK